MTNEIDDFKRRIKATTGYSDSIINAAWPEWWSKDATGSASAEAELRFSVARKLGLDPRSLLDANGPRLMWDDTAKYKRFKGDKDEHRAITSFGTSVNRMLSKGITERINLTGFTAVSIRSSILKNQPFVKLQDLISLLWSVGIPIIHLKVYPLAAKHMSAMAISSSGNYSVLMAKDAQYPAWTAFSVAHEIGHICLGHIVAESALIDMEDPLDNEIDEEDDEEIASDRFALELLTGDPDFKLEVGGDGNNPAELANQALSIATEYGIEPGTLALCYGYQTGKWTVVQNALKIIYTQPAPVWEFINHTAKSQLNWEGIGDDNTSYLHALMGGL